MRFNTYSIVARCDRSGELGAAIASATPAVGAFCVWLRAGVGAVCTQSWTNPHLAIAALDAMSDGCTARVAGERALVHDRGAALRQLGVVALTDAPFAWTGADCSGWCGHLTGKGFAAQGNMLTGREVVTAMAERFERTSEEPLDERLLQALEAAQTVGGDRRGRQSAALATIAHRPWRRVDLRIDEHADPIAELRRVHGIARAQLAPFEAALPDAGGDGAALAEADRKMIIASPPVRPMGGGSAEP